MAELPGLTSSRVSLAKARAQTKTMMGGAGANQGPNMTTYHGRDVGVLMLLAIVNEDRN